jgi:PII-like signaling protein
MVVEIVDSCEQIEGFLPMVEMLLKDAGAQALVTRAAAGEWTR